MYISIYIIIYNIHIYIYTDIISQYTTDADDFACPCALHGVEIGLLMR